MSANRQWRRLSGWGVFLGIAVAGLIWLGNLGWAGDVTADKMTVNDALYLGGSNGVYNVTNAVMARWQMDDNAGNATVVDSSGRGHSSAISGGGNTADHHVTGRVGSGALTFDGVNDYIQIANHADLLMGTNSFTLAAWIKTDRLDYQGGGMIFDKLTQDSYYPQYCVMLCPPTGNIQFLTHNNGYSYLDSVGTVPVDVWTHVVAVRNCNGLHQIYINGRLDVEAVMTVRNVSNSTPLSLGFESRWDGDCYFDGAMDEMCVFNKALSAAEIRELYNEGLGTDQLTGTQHGVVKGELIFEGNTNRIKGNLRIDQGVIYTKPLGDVNMGSFTNMP